MIRNKFILTAAAALCFLGLQEVRANHVDFMTDGAFMQTGAGTQQVMGAQSNILGGIRNVAITGGTASLSAGGPLVFTSSANPPGTTLTLGYGAPYGGAAGTPPSGSFPANFVTNSGPNWNSIVVSLSNVSMGATATLSLSVTDSNNNAFTFASQTVNAAGNYTFFYNQAPGTINFQSISGVQTMLSTNVNSSSYSLSGITRVTSIPEPSSVTLAVAAGFGLLILLRRRRTA